MRANIAAISAPLIARRHAVAAPDIQTHATLSAMRMLIFRRLLLRYYMLLMLMLLMPA